MHRILVVEDTNHPNFNFKENFDLGEFRFYLTSGIKNGLEITQKYHPDLIICQIEHSKNLLEFFESLNASPDLIKIPVICVTNSNDISKIEEISLLGADAFLLTPIDPKKLKLVIDIKLKKIEAIKQSENIFQQTNFEQPRDNQDIKDHLLITIGNRINLIKYEDIKAITAIREYTYITCQNKEKIIVRKSLNHWMKMLPSKSFLRIHRSIIININYIEKIMKIRERNYVVYIKGISEPFSLSQRFAQIMRDSFLSM